MEKLETKDIRFEREGEITWVTICREERGNQFRNQTVREMIAALEGD